MIKAPLLFLEELIFLGVPVYNLFMALKYEIINPLYYPDWDHILVSNKNYSFFHSSIWAKVLVESYRYTPLYFTLFDNEKLVALIPVMEARSFLTGRKGISMPFSDFCEPILFDETKFNSIFNHIINYGKKQKWKYFYAKGWGQYLPEELLSNFCYEHLLQLEKDPYKVFSKFRNSTKRNIKKAQNMGVKVSFMYSLDSIREFYRLNCLSRKEHGLPPQPFSFFQKLHEHIISTKKGTVILAKYKDKNIAGAVFLHIGNKALYKYGASNKAFQNLRANNLVMWNAIEDYCQKGFENLSFGITDPFNDGLMQYKRGWGANERKVLNFKYVLSKDKFVSSKSFVKGCHNRIFSAFPIIVLKFLGNLLYKHIA